MQLPRSVPAVPLVMAAALTLAACSDASEPALSTLTPGSGGAETSGGAVASTVELPPRLVLSVPDPDSIYDPIRGGETPPEGYRQLLRRDAIAPVYDPTFTTADGVGWPEDSLVIGVDLEGEARAYPVGFLNRREIVNDNHRGIPTLVTW